jgi:hypothetical protein
MRRLMAKYRGAAGYGILANLSESANNRLKANGVKSPLTAAREDLANALEVMSNYKFGLQGTTGPGLQELSDRSASRVAASVHQTLGVHFAPSLQEQPRVAMPASYVATRNDSHRSTARSQPRFHANGTKANTRPKAIEQTTSRIENAETALLQGHKIRAFRRIYQTQAEECAGAALLEAVVFEVYSQSDPACCYDVTISGNPDCTCPDRRDHRESQPFIWLPWHTP